MADKPTNEPMPEPTDAPDEQKPSGEQAKITPAMSESEIRAAGLAIDVPFESGQPEPERLAYADLGMTWSPPEGWPPEQGQPQDQDDLNA